MVLAETAGSPQPAPVVPVPLGQLLLSSRVGMLATGRPGASQPDRRCWGGGELKTGREHEVTRVARDPETSARDLPETVISKPCAESQRCGAHRDGAVSRPAQPARRAQPPPRQLAGAEKALIP